MSLIVSLNISRIARISNFILRYTHLVIKECFDDVITIGRNGFNVIGASTVD